MGQLLSRAFRRFTQCHSSNQAQQQLQQQQQETNEQAQRQRAYQPAERENRPTVQQIPVGQSIDSADYAAFEASKQTTKPRIAIKQRSDEEGQADKENKIVTNLAENTDEKSSDSPKPQVEEAVIKIQAYVRGHLTRKALKDAQQQHATVSPNALGQSQFDEESLMKNPPTGHATPKLESIAEESQNQTSLEKKDSRGDIIKEPSLELATQNQSLSLQVDDDIVGCESISPVPSEANASIDLNCDTPASASIDISDHYIQPTNKMASVLHFKASPVPITDGKESQSENIIQQSPDAPQVIESTPTEVQTYHNEAGDHTQLASFQTPQNALMNSSSHSIDSAEAAAIRIQSAFRGYHTRKHSPYRRRSPNSLPLTSLNSNGCILEEINGPLRRAALRQQDATEMDDERDDGVDIAMDSYTREQSEAEREMLVNAEQVGRRQSRQRQRDLNQDGNEVFFNDQSAATDDSTIIEVQPEAGDWPTDENSGLSLSDDRSKKDIIQTGFDASNQLSQRLSDVDEASFSDTSRAKSSDREESSQKIIENQPALTKAASQQTASIDLDTESSNLGAALSMNEEAGDNQINQMIALDGMRKVAEVTGIQTELDNEDDSQSYSIGANLVDESSIHEPQAVGENEKESSDDNGTQITETALNVNEINQTSLNRQNDSEAAEIIDKDCALDEDSQRMLELESDDIELRDPRGQASDERAKSPQLRPDQPDLTTSVKASACVTNVEHSRLTVESPDEAFASGPSSPALVSSNAGTSSEDEAESDVEKPSVGKIEEKNSTTAATGHGPGGSKNRKKNRNKKKNKK